MANSTNLTNTRILNMWNALPTSIAIFLSALNIFLSLTTSVGNTLILIALYKVSYIHPPTKLLFRCLAFTDLCVGLISHPVQAFRLINFSIFKNYEDYSSNHFFVISRSMYFVSAVIWTVISIVTSAAISVVRLLALLLRLRYRHVVTLRRVRAFIFVLV